MFIIIVCSDIKIYIYKGTIGELKIQAPFQVQDALKRKAETERRRREAEARGEAFEEERRLEGGLSL